MRVHLPLQQGLRLLDLVLLMLKFVRVHLPLQQGLRLLSRKGFRVLSCRVRVHLPLQQGLRLKKGEIRVLPVMSASASSITTRIKTITPTE